MTANENMDRRSAEEPQQIPVNNYFDFDAGIMQACVARDFHYALLMPEPEQGYASIMKNSAAYQKFFCLSCAGTLSGYAGAGLLRSR